MLVWSPADEPSLSARLPLEPGISVSQQAGPDLRLSRVPPEECTSRAAASPGAVPPVCMYWDRGQINGPGLMRKFAHHDL